MDCIRTARAKGLKEKTVIYSHAWPERSDPHHYAGHRLVHRHFLRLRGR